MNTYWDSYYTNQVIVNNSVPSQFAAFVARNHIADNLVIDFGCGTCRDTRFFDWLGYESIGVEASDAAITAVKAVFPQLRVIKGTPESLANQIKTFHFESNKQIFFYCRFVLHALSDAELSSLSSALNECSQYVQKVAFEFRLPEDESLSKVHADHMRVYRTIESVRDLFNSNTYGVGYSHEGTGLAVHGAEDAYVGRLILISRSQ